MGFHPALSTIQHCLSPNKQGSCKTSLLEQLLLSRVEQVQIKFRLFQEGQLFTDCLSLEFLTQMKHAGSYAEGEKGNSRHLGQENAQPPSLRHWIFNQYSSEQLLQPGSAPPQRGVAKKPFHGDYKMWEYSHSEPERANPPDPPQIYFKTSPKGTRPQMGSGGTKVWSTSPAHFPSSSL